MSKQRKARLIPNIAGMFSSHDDWVNTATAKLAGVKGSIGEPLEAICVDKKGRRCHNGKDMRNAEYPVYYFWNCERE